MTGPRVSELEAWPARSGRRPTPRVLALLAAVYETGLHNLLDLDDREHLAPADQFLLNGAGSEAAVLLRKEGVIDDEAALAPAARDGGPARRSTLLTTDPGSQKDRDGRRRGWHPAARGGPPGLGGVYGWGSRVDEIPGGWSLERMVMMAARETADFGRDVGRGAVGPITIEQFEADLTWLAERYPNRPVAPSFAEAVELRDRAFALLEGRPHPGEARDLYLIAGTLCGMLANASFDLGYMDAAMTQARTAFLCGELAGHNGLRCWVRGMQSLIAYWRGRTSEAAILARTGWEFVPERGTARVRAAALEARAMGRLGDVDGMQDALRRAEEARAQITRSDQPGGMLAFPEAKLMFYTASAYLGPARTLPDEEWATRAERAADTAIGLYAGAPAGEQRLGELSLARLDLAAARLERSEVEGAGEPVRSVLVTTTQRPTDSVLRRLRQLATMTERAGLRELPPAQHLREEILDVCASVSTARDGVSRGAPPE